MCKKGVFAWGKRGVSFLLAAAMTIGALPVTGVTAKAADNDPYVVSQGRMIYASSTRSNSDSNLAADGDESTRWESGWSNDEEWLYVDLGKVTEITSVRLMWEGAYATSYQLQFSDDEENWDTKYRTSDCKGGTEELKISGNARFVRIWMDKKALPAYGYSLYEFQVLGRNGLTERPVDYGENLAKGKTATASSLRDVWWMYDENGVIDQTNVLAKNAVDGKGNTYWTSGEADDQWLCVDLGKSYTIGRVVIDWSSDAGKIYDIQVSEDGNNWTTAYRQLKGHAHEKANVQMHVNARYVRVFGYTRVENGSGFSICELEIYPYKNGDPMVTHPIQDLPEMQVVNAKSGKGSYVTNAMYLEKAKLPTYLKEGLKAPIDSNDWWQSAIINKFGNLMSVLPLKAKYSAKGLSLLTATEGWLPEMGETDVNISVQSETVPDLCVMPENLDPATAYDQVSGYSDYAVDIELCDKNGTAMTTTFVKGSPYVFAEFGDRMSAFLSGDSIKSIFDDNGNTLLENTASLVTDHIGIEVVDTDNRDKTETSANYYCISVPEGTTFKKTGSYIKVTFPAADGYMSIGSMTKRSELHTFYQHGYAFVEDTSVTYRYDEDTANMSADYQVTTSVKRNGFSAETIQCMLPHQWKKSADDEGSISTYTSVRGDLKAVIKNRFTTSEIFEGLLPTFAMPDNEEFNSEKLVAYLCQLEDATKDLRPAGDAYWEGKNLHPLGMGVLMADQLGETELRDTFLARIKTILTNWFHYDGADDVSYFIYDKQWGTLYYLQSEFGANTAICDHHFTYGYFMFAATVLATYDDEFYHDYKEMIEMMIRDYANPSDSDSEYCRFRSYDLYEGHSWAGGYADNDSGNNQESASESLFSWVTLYLWGVLTGEDTYRDAGIFGFTNEMDTVKQYWFDYDLDNWVEEWPYEVVGQVYGGINFYGTFFGGQPLYVYGIQWLPISEYLTYYGMDQQRCADIYSGLLKDTEIAMNKAVLAAQKEGKPEAEIQSMLDTYPQADTGWQHITWPFLSQTNPSLALEKFNEYAANVQKTDTANTYWFINSMMKLGYKTDKIWATGDVAASVYYNPNTNQYTANVWNPTNEAKVVSFRTNDGVVGTATVGAKALVDFEVYTDRSFTITQASTPVISVSSGKYEDTQYVEIETDMQDAVIYYTTDGSMPTRSSKVYDGVFAVSSTATVKAIAVKEGCIDSPMASSTIEISGAEISGSENLASGKTVETSSNENEGVDGSKMVDGDAATRWASGFSDDEWFILDLGETYTINKVTLDWEASYAEAYQLQVSEDKEQWSAVYETKNAKGGNEELVIDAVSCRYVKFVGSKRALPYGYSLWEIGVYEAAKAEKPEFSLPAGNYTGEQQLTIKSNTAGVEIRYTTDGSTPDESSKLYVPTVKIAETTTIKAIAYKKGMIASDVAEAVYVIDGSGENPNPDDGEFSDINLAKGKETAQSGSEADAMNAKYAVDGDEGTRWSSDFADDAWMSVDLGKDYEIGKVVLKWEDAFAEAYDILVSADGKNWNKVYTTENGAGGKETITFPICKARYVKLQGIKRAMPYGYSLWEMEVYGINISEEEERIYGELAAGKTATASGSEADAMDVRYAIDGDAGTRWASDYADDAWMMVDLSKSYQIDKVVINWEAAYGKAYQILVSEDGENWTLAYETSNGAGGEETVTFPACNARYVKLQGVERALPYGYSVWEFAVYGK